MWERLLVLTKKHTEELIFFYLWNVSDEPTMGLEVLQPSCGHEGSPSLQSKEGRTGKWEELGPNDLVTSVNYKSLDPV